ncbi:phytoene desaturase family protein [Dictyobacter kobayashii]|uniref:Dehydrogenase n=1 Tax=Dictyobacter kobayashii TaxID=2014872 RepID=A0A402AQN8_9CHLR|nr:NAD(P)/FAD-dependent oxidoreductase [Dictyobacter kobayashii]GCE21380.1 dehydrogenase [Dictyobacter kobayashii]
MDTAKLQQADVLIVGGGLAGLSAACYLARSGASVRLYEKSTGLGGRASTTNYDGFLLNRGAHALYTGGAAEEVLQELAIPYNGHKPGSLYVLRQGKLHVFPASVGSLLQTSLLSFRDKLELGRFFSKLPTLKTEELARVSVNSWLHETIKRPRVREFLTMFACTNVYSSALDLVSAEVLAYKLQLSLKHPILYIDGGWQTLVEGLRQAAVRAGAQLINNCRVEAVEYTAGQVQGIQLANGQRVQAKAVIIATTPQEALKLVEDGSYAPLQQIVQDLLPAPVACLDLALSRLPDPTHPIVQDTAGPHFMTSQSLYARIAPEGGAVIHTFKLLDPTRPSEPQEDERALERLLDSAQPGWRELVLKRVFLPHIQAVGMLPTVASGGYAGRPGPQVPGIHNLLLAGDWIGAGFLADASLGSARQAARLLLQEGRLNTRIEAISVLQ